MVKLPRAIIQSYLGVTGSIAFWPSIIVLGFFFLAIFIWNFEGTDLSGRLESGIPIFKNIKEDTENARLLINTLATGTITLTIFSFSMVMIVLNQASSNLSPRVIPGLISVKSHQIVLGVYVGSIIYTLFLILSFKPEAVPGSTIPVLGIVLGLVFGIICLVMFVYFIHSISRAIQVDIILKRIYDRALKDFEGTGLIAIDNEKEKQFPDTAEWSVFACIESGYLRRIEKDKLLKFTHTNDLIIEILVPLGTFMVSGYPFLKVNRDVKHIADFNKIIQECFIFSLDEMVMTDFEYNCKQICEIGVKALSPGINDPGTATSAVNFLSLLFSRQLQLKETTFWNDNQNQLRVLIKRSPLTDLLFRYLTPIRTYGKGDVIVIIKLFECMNKLVYLDQPVGQFAPVLSLHTNSIRDDADQGLPNRECRERVNISLKEINALLDPDLQIPYLDLNHVF